MTQVHDTLLTSLTCSSFSAKPISKITKVLNYVTEKHTQEAAKIASLLLLLPLFLILLLPLLFTFKTSVSPSSLMDTLISLVNRIQRACTLLGDHGADHASASLWESLPSVAVVGGQVRFSFKFD